MRVIYSVFIYRRAKMCKSMTYRDNDCVACHLAAPISHHGHRFRNKWPHWNSIASILDFCWRLTPHRDPFAAFPSGQKYYLVITLKGLITFGLIRSTSRTGCLITIHHSAKSYLYLPYHRRTDGSSARCPARPSIQMIRPRRLKGEVE